jgi:hypothetical protein
MDDLDHYDDGEGDGMPGDGGMGGVGGVDMDYTAYGLAAAAAAAPDSGMMPHALPMQQAAKRKRRRKTGPEGVDINGPGVAAYVEEAVEEGEPIAQLTNQILLCRLPDGEGKGGVKRKRPFTGEEDALICEVSTCLVASRQLLFYVI